MIERERLRVLAACERLCLSVIVNVFERCRMIVVVVVYLCECVRVPGDYCIYWHQSEWD